MVDLDRTDWLEPTAELSSIADLAWLASAAIEQQLAVDPSDEAAIARIITTVFGRIDPGELHRIAEAVSEIVGEGKQAPAR